MATKLKEYFPAVREREELLTEIEGNETLQKKFGGWTEEQQEEFLDICTGVRGLKFLYDGFFKEILNPEYVPERFNDFLSSLMGRRAKVLKVLPGDSVRIADEGKKFSYRDVKNVYTIVLFEKSPREFHRYPEKYCHFFEQKSDTGLELELLQKYVLIPLDIFMECSQNKGISEKRDAWLTLLVRDEPEKIIELLGRYPEFRPIYEEGYEICRNTERVMEMFSKELYELDRNTVQYMIDEQQETIDAQKKELDAQKEELAKQQETIAHIYRSTVNMLRSLNISDEVIVEKLCAQYRLKEVEARKYL